MKKGLKILVADDDARMVRTLCDILTARGYEPIAAHSGEEVVAKVRGRLPDCVLMDLKMPGLDGLETLARIRAGSPNLPVVLMSALATERQAAEAQRLGAYAVLTKPVEVSQLLSFLVRLFKKPPTFH